MYHCYSDPYAPCFHLKHFFGYLPTCESHLTNLLAIGHNNFPDKFWQLEYCAGAHSNYSCHKHPNWSTASCSHPDSYESRNTKLIECYNYSQSDFPGHVPSKPATNESKWIGEPATDLCCNIGHSITTSKNGHLALYQPSAAVFNGQ